MTNMLAGSMMPLLTIKRLIASRCWGATLKFFLAKALRLFVESFLLPSSQSIFSVYFPSMARNQSETKTWNQFRKAAKTHISYFYLICCTVIKTWEQNEPEKNKKEMALRCIAVYSDALLSTEMRQIFYFSCTAFTCCCRIFCFLSVQQINIRCFSREHLPRWPKAIKMIWPISQSHCPP